MPLSAPSRGLALGHGSAHQSAEQKVLAAKFRQLCEKGGVFREPRATNLALRYLRSGPADC